MLQFWFVLLVFGIQHKLSTGENLSEYLWRETELERQEALNSYFVQGIKNASLDPIKFGTYLVQDAIYLYYSAKGMSKAGGKAETNLKSFLLENAVKRYESLYKDAFKDWHISDPKNTYLSNECENYVNHLLKVAHKMEPIYLVIACIPCENLWPWLGGQLGVGKEDFGVYNSWVNINWDPTYDGYREFENIIDEAYKEGSVDKELALAIYKESMRGEADFFNSIMIATEPKLAPHDEF